MAKKNQEAQPSIEDLMAQIAELTAKNAELANAANKAPSLSFKVSEAKQCLSVYGIGRRPATFYAGQWLAIMERAGDLCTFARDNIEKLSVKEGQDRAELARKFDALVQAFAPAPASDTNDDASNNG